MTTINAYEEVPEAYKEIIGEPDAGTRLYRAEGGQEDFEKWYNTVREICSDGIVSPGGANMFAPVTRAAVYKALQEGRLSAFFFHITKKYKSWRGKEIKYRNSPYGYVSVRELKIWKADLMERAGSVVTVEQQKAIQTETTGTRKDWRGDFLEFPKARIKAEKMKAKQDRDKK